MSIALNFSCSVPVLFTMSQTLGKIDSTDAKHVTNKYGVRYEPFHDAAASIDEEDNPVGSDCDFVPNVEASASQENPVPQEIHIPENPGEDLIAEETIPTKSATTPSSSKDGDTVSVCSEDTHSDEPSQTPTLVQNISDDDDSDEVLLTEAFLESVSAKMKRKRRAPVSEAPSMPQKKTKPTPTTYKSKQVDVKGKGCENQGREKEEDVPDIVAAEKKKFAGRRIKNVLAAPLDNVFFHFEENVLKWKYVYQRRLAREREVGSDVLECKEVMTLIEKARLMKSVLQVDRCFERLVKEFVVNLSVEVELPKSDEYRKVYVRDKYVKFSPAVINGALGRSDVVVVAEEQSLDVITKELTARKVQKWPKNKFLSTENLSVNMQSLIILTLKPAETCAVKLPISFPSLITEIILQQHPKIVRDDGVAISKGAPITLNHRLFFGPHVLDITVPSSRTSASTLVAKSGRKAIIDEL
ncbi:uncharacterized protein LOC130712583 [Lotus japonicus]|uniref:uncharacterized protein LOC130712583 n=1 Tax=Lotus japonicus TaxID=34305 RepID=UPI0025886E84|nr:uncharacterized protein LOC130712583 [Lotus japonicus]